MSVVKRIAAVLMAGALSLSVSFALAQQQARPRRGGGGIPTAFLMRLNLTPEQQAKVKDAQAARMAEAEKIRALTDAMEKRQAAMKAAKAYDDAVKAALTPEQQKQLEALVAESAEYRALGPLGNSLVGLNLTADQKAKVKEIGAKYQPEMEKLRAAAQGATDPAAIRGQQRELSTKLTEEVKAVLTPDQLKQFVPPMARRRPNANQ